MDMSMPMLKSPADYAKELSGLFGVLSIDDIIKQVSIFSGASGPHYLAALRHELRSLKSGVK